MAGIGNGNLSRISFLGLVYLLCYDVGWELLSLLSKVLAVDWLSRASFPRGVFIGRKLEQDLRRIVEIGESGRPRCRELAEPKGAELARECETVNTIHIIIDVPCLVPANLLTRHSHGLRLIHSGEHIRCELYARR